MKKIALIFSVLILNVNAWSFDATVETLEYPNGLMLEDRAMALLYPARFADTSGFAGLYLDATSGFEDFVISAGKNITFVGLVTASDLDLPVMYGVATSSTYAPVAVGGGVAAGIGTVNVGGVVKVGYTKTVNSNALSSSLVRLSVNPSVKLKLAEATLDVGVDAMFSMGDLVSYTSSGGSSTNTNTYSFPSLPKIGLFFALSKDLSSDKRVAFWGGVSQINNSPDVSEESGSYKTNYSYTEKKIDAYLKGGVRYKPSDDVDIFGSVGVSYSYEQYNEDYALGSLTSFEYRKVLSFPVVELGLRKDIGSGFKATFGSTFTRSSAEEVDKTSTFPKRELIKDADSSLSLSMGLEYSYSDLEIRTQFGGWVYDGGLFLLTGGTSSLFAKFTVYYNLSGLSED